MKEWNNIHEYKDCPPLNKKVLVVHDKTFYIGVFERDGNNGYCWKIENDEGIEWVDIFDVEGWQDISSCE